MAEKRRLVVAADLLNLGAVREFVEQACHALGAQESAISDLRLAVDELVTNIIVHGYGGKGGAIELEVETEADALLVRLRDTAAVFDPSAHAVPAPVDRLESGEPGGFGLSLVRNLVDEVRHRATSTGGNEVTLIKRGAIDAV